MASLSGNKIKDTYQSLIKLTDNGNLTTGAKQLTDGFGNNSPLYISTTQIGIGVTPEATYDLHVYQNAKVGGNLTITGDLTVNGTTTTVDTDTLRVEDPLIEVARNNTSSDAVDIGIYGKYAPSGTTLYAGLFRDTGDDKFKLFKSLEEQPTTTVNTSGTGYAVATLVANFEGNVTGDLTGNADTATALETARTIQVSGDVAGSASFDGTADINISTTIQANSVALGTDTTGNYVATISGTTNEIEVSGSGSETAAVTIGLPDDVTVTGNLTVNGTGISLSNATNPTITVTDSTNGHYLTMQGLDGASKIDYLSTLIFEYGAGNTEAARLTSAGLSISEELTVSGTGQSSFAGQVTIPATPSASTDAASKGYVDSQVGANNELSEVLANGNTTGGTDIAVSSGDDITFADSSQAIFGAGSDLKIFSDGSGGYIRGVTAIQSQDGTDDFLSTAANAGVSLFYNNSKKFETTNTGINVIGGITGDDSVFIEGNTNPNFTAHDITNETYTSLWSGDTEAALTFNHSLFRITSSAYNFTGTDLVTITSGGNTTFAGNVSINSTSSPAKNLVVEGDSSAYATIRVLSNSTGHGAEIEFGDSSDVDYGSITQFASSAGEGGRMRFRAGGTETMNLRGGNVGIGTTSPDAKLHIQGTNSGVLIDTSTAYTPLIKASGTLSDLSLSAVGNGGNLILTAEGPTASIIQLNCGGSERMRIDSSGNVLITKQAANNATVGNQFMTDGSANSTVDGDTVARFNRLGTDGEIIRFQHDTSTDGAINSSSGRIAIGSSSTGIFFDSIRDVVTPHNMSTNTYSSTISLGRSAIPFKDLYLSGSAVFVDGASYSSAASIRQQSNALIFSGGSTGYYFNKSDNSATHMFINSSGNVGIGTTSPRNDANFVTLQVGSTATAASQIVLDDNDSNGPWRIISNQSLIINDDATERMRIESDGTVQITNSTSPKLQLKRGTKEYTTRVDNNNKFVIQEEGGNEFFVVESGASSNSIRIDSSGKVGIGTTNPQNKFVIKEGSNVDMEFGSEADGCFIQTYNRTTSSWGYLRFIAGGGERMRITRVGGEVLINQTSDLTGQIFQVNGMIDQTDVTKALRVYNGSTFLGGIGSGQWAISATYANDYALYAQNNLLFHAGTGSSIDMMIDANHNVGIATTSPSAKLHVNGVITANDTIQVQGDDSGFVCKNAAGTVIGTIGAVSSSTTNIGMFTVRNNGNNRIVLHANGSSYFNGGNVGIGTTSPSRELDIQASSGWAEIALRGNTGAGGSLEFWTTTTKRAEIFADTEDIVFRNTASNTERMRIDSSGNLSLATATSLDFNVADFAQIKFKESGAITIDSDNNQSSRNFQFKDGDGSSLMFIGDDGNVGIGTTNPQNKFVVANGTDNTQNIEIAPNYIQSFNRQSGNLGYASMGFYASSYDFNVGYVGIGRSPQTGLTLPQGSGAANKISWYDVSDTFAASIYSNSSNDSLTFATKTSSNVETTAMVININQNVGIGLTSPSEKLEVTTGGNIYAGRFDYSGTNGAKGALMCRLLNSNSPSFIDFWRDSYSTSSPVGAIVTGGSNVLYQSYSDYRLKENVEDLTGALDRVNNLQPKIFNYINAPEITNEGFLAHELQEIVPQAVSGEKDGMNEDGTPKYQGVDNAHIVPLLVGAIKELKAEIETLKAQIN